jgi:hypothetical protein
MVVDDKLDDIGGFIKSSERKVGDGIEQVRRGWRF